MEEDMITLLIENVPVICKKKELIEHSDYFKVMFEGNFSERNKNVITLEEIDLKSMNLILNLLWDQTVGPYMINDDDLLSVLQTACMLQFNNIRDTCINILTEKLNPENCIKVWFACEYLGLQPIYLKAKNLALIEFNVIKDIHALLDLDITQLHSYLANVMLQCKSEVDVFTACMQWYYENGAGDPKTLLKLMCCVDFDSAKKSEVQEMLLMPDIYNNRMLSEIFRVITIIKEDENVFELLEKENPLVVNAAKRCLNSTGRYKSSTDPIFFVKNNENCNEEDDNTNEKVSYECYDIYKRKRKYTRIDGQDNSIAALIIYDKQRKKYIKCVDIPEEKYVGCEGFHIVGYKEQIFLFGGELTLGSGHWNLNFWVYDTIRDRWERKTRLPTGRRHFNSCICGPYLYIIGGTGAFRIIQDNMYWYNYQENIWSTQILLPCPARQLKCCNYNDQLLLLNMNYKCGYLFNNNNFVKLVFIDDEGIVAVYPDHFTVFSYNDRIYLKSSTLIEFNLLEKNLRVSNVWSLNCSRLTMSSDSMESIVCNNTVFTLYKCSQGGGASVHVEMMSMIDPTYEINILSPPEGYNIDLSSKLFSIQHHCKMVDTDIYVHNLRTYVELETDEKDNVDKCQTKKTNIDREIALNIM